MKLLICILLCVIFLAGCSTHHLSSEAIKNKRQDSYPILSTVPFSGSISRSINNQYLTMQGIYYGTITHHHGTGSLTMSGYFGMDHEPLHLSWLGNRSHDADKAYVHIMSGFLLFGPKNQHNTGSLNQSITYTLPEIRQHMYDLFRYPLSFSSATFSHSGNSTIMGLERENRSISGSGDANYALFTGSYKQQPITVEYSNNQRTHTRKTYHIVLEKSKKNNNILIKYLPRRYPEATTECIISKNFLQGKCTLPPPAGDRFMQQEPLMFLWSTHLASH